MADGLHRLLRRLGATGVLLVLATLCALMLPAAAQANAVTITGSMEGSIQIANGDDVAAGYSFAASGSHPAMTVRMANASVVFQGSCSNGGTGTLTIPLNPGPWNVPQDDNNWYPTGDEQSPQSFQGSVVVHVCGGSGTLDASNGATFSANLQSDYTLSQVAVRFHYRDPNAKGKGNYDCSAATYAASICGASWSGTASLYPSSPPPPPAKHTCTTSSGKTITYTGSQKPKACTQTRQTHTCTTSSGKTITYTGPQKPKACTTPPAKSTHFCRTRSGKTIRYTGSRKPAACTTHPRRASRKPKHPSGFTG